MRVCVCVCVCVQGERASCDLAGLGRNFDRKRVCPCGGAKPQVNDDCVGDGENKSTEFELHIKVL